MKEKKKLFGKLNIVDVLVILVVLAAVAFLAIRGFNLIKDPDTVGLPTRIRYQVEVIQVSPAMYDSIRRRLDSGENRLVAGESFIDGYVVDLKAEPFRTTQFNESTNKFVYVEDPYFLTLTFTVEAEVTSPVNQQVVSQEVRIGRGNTVKTLGFEVYGTVLNVETVEK